MASRSLNSKRVRSAAPGLLERPSSPSLALVMADSPRSSKKLKLHSSFVDESPFPNFGHPTSAEAREVYDLLSDAHGTHGLNRNPPALPSEFTGTPLSTSNVIEGLIDTILSQSTTAHNSTRAKKNLDAAFGRNNFSAIATAPRETLVEAIRSGGLANKKAATIQNILHSIKERHGDYSLQHLASIEENKRLTDDAIMKELISYDGVGPKTASCVLLFTLGRDSFAVDTHVFRLSKVLGWVPARADRVLAQAHLDRCIPDEVKYGLHILMIRHGRICKGCKTATSGQACLLKSHLKKRMPRNYIGSSTDIEEHVTDTC